MSRRVALLLLGSGFCALVYQTAWLRLMRLIFGASTLSSAAVLAIFMGGLGFGGLLLGRRADRHPSPLRLYADLELAVAAAAALSPFLVEAARDIYVALGGSARLGLTAGTGVRLALSALVLGLPAFLMGGTLPAAVRAVATSGDRGRRDLGFLYAANTLGAVGGILATTFFALETLGIRQTIFVAALLNALIAIVARSWSRTRVARDEPAPATPYQATDDEASTNRPAPTRFILVAAAVVGFTFLLMELVWYRTLAPLLGGSTYTFSLILAIALAGIGIGGLAYGAGERRRRPDPTLLASTCAFEAVFLALPLALGDHLAVFAVYTRPIAATGFAGLVVVWTLIAAVVVLPAAIIAGYQFPLLVALLGTGRESVGRQIGQCYAWNTVGSIAGSIAGGFGLLPLLGAVGAWRGAVASLALLALAAAAVARRAGGHIGLPVGVAIAGLALCLAPGPTAVWRHTPIGAGRVEPTFANRNDLKAWQYAVRRSIAWEVDGVESSVAVNNEDGLAFVINGKADGNARVDAATQVNLGLIGAALHPSPERALVIGLGTGSTAGWLAAVPGLDTVDVVEIEPAILDYARDCAAVNHDALDAAGLTVHIADAREYLMTPGPSYDVIASEPSNPYRAGIASLFTQEFYRASRDRLTADGIFVQWLQAYEIDIQTTRTIYATLASVFEHVQTWQVGARDLLLAASAGPLRPDLGRLEQRLAAEPLASALPLTWGVDGTAGFYTAFVATTGLARAFAELEGGWLNTDDRNLVEFGFARSVGRSQGVEIGELRALAAALGADRAPLAGDLDWRRVEDLRAARSVALLSAPAGPSSSDPLAQRRLAARSAYARGDLRRARAAWPESEPAADSSHIDLVMTCELRATAGDSLPPACRDRLRTIDAVEADLIAALHEIARGDDEAASKTLARTWRGYREDPWPYPKLMSRGLEATVELAMRRPDVAAELFAALAEPFSVYILESDRRQARYRIATLGDFFAVCREALAPLEPWVPWDVDLLRSRLSCYRAHGDPRAAIAARELASFESQSPIAIDTGLTRKPR